MNAAKRYSIYAMLPVVVFLLGLIVYKDPIDKMLANNPHPELIYGIFAFLFFGVVMMFGILYRYAVEQKRLQIYLAEKGVDANSTDRLKRAARVAGGRDAPIYPIFSLLSLATRRMTIQEGRGAVERELEVYTKRITAWMSLPQFLGGLLIGMGLVGTFVGLLAALDEIATVLSSLAVPVTSGSESAAAGAGIFQAMIGKLQKPMQSMGIAFSASLFGLLGSIILGFMMVAVRRCSQEVVAHLRVETYKVVGEAFGWADGGADVMLDTFAATDSATTTSADPKMVALLERLSDQVEKSMANNGAFAGDMAQATRTLQSAVADLASYVKQLREAQVESERNRLIQRELALLDLSGRIDTLVTAKQTPASVTGLDQTRQ